MVNTFNPLNISEFSPIIAKFQDLHHRLNITNHQLLVINETLFSKRLAEGISLDEKINREIEIDSKQLLIYQNRRIFIYIRDIVQQQDLPKFHFTNCEKMMEVRTANRLDKRYVMSSQSEDSFLLHIDRIPTKKTLQSCLYCCKLVGLKTRITASQYIEKFGNTIVPSTEFNVHNAPNSNYTDDWHAISMQLRGEKNYTCEICKVNCSFISLKRFIHVHHQDRDRTNNNLNNLLVVCIECHAKQPNHEHMMHHQDLITFRNIKQSLRITPP